MNKHESKPGFPYLVTVTYIFNEKGEALLQEKARGFGKGNWNGPGGKIYKGESPEESAKREVREETDIIVEEVELAGETEFIFMEAPENNNYCYIYRAKSWHGEPKDMGEGKLEWFKIQAVPLDKMWDDDKFWLPQVLRGKNVHMRFYFDNDGKVVKKEKI